MRKLRPVSEFFFNEFLSEKTKSLFVMEGEVDFFFFLHLSYFLCCVRLSTLTVSMWDHCQGALLLI